MSSPLIYDIVGIGVGPFNLSLAALLHPIKELKSIFFEKNNSFNWHPGMMISGTTLQVPFYADLVTLADPCSRFSFFSFLKYKNRLIRFSIYDHHFISRKLFNEYCRWVATQLDNLYFNHEVLSVCYNKDKNCYQLKVTTTNEQTIIYARRIVCGIGTVPCLPSFVNQFTGASVFHSSSYLFKKKNLLGKTSISIIGSGQSAAEIFYDLLQNISPDSKKELTWITRSKNFFPMDYSKLSLELTSPDYINYFYHLPEQKKATVLKGQGMFYKGINFSLIDRIYDRLYELSEDCGQLPVKLMPNMVLKNMIPDGKMYQLEFFQKEQGRVYRNKAHAVIFATGYTESTFNFFNAVRNRIKWKTNGNPDVNFNYSIDINQNELFVQNAELQTHGFNAPDLGMGPYRNAIIINTILGYEYYQIEEKVAFQKFGV